MLYLPQDLPAAATLGAQTFPLQDWQQVSSVKRVLFLNLMPQKQVTESDIARTLHDTGENVQLIPLKIRGQRYKTTPQAYVEQFYLDFEEIAAFCFDRLIITGAPVEQIPFEEVRYWDALCHIMDWADRPRGSEPFTSVGGHRPGFTITTAFPSTTCPPSVSASLRRRFSHAPIPS